MDYFKIVESSLNEACKECKDNLTDRCVKTKCNVGFALNAIKGAKANGPIRIQDGRKMLPKEDMKFYEENNISKGIAGVCRLCKECKEYHSEDCIISLLRRALEHTQLQEEEEYQGNVLMYLLNISKQNPTFADKIKNEYMLLED